MRITWLFILIIINTNLLANDNFPEVPYSEEIQTASDMIQDARTSDFDTETDGYQVTSPDGNIFYIDDIEEPTQIFYGLYINIDENQIITPDIEINSNININEVCFDNCY